MGPLFSPEDVTAAGAERPRLSDVSVALEDGGITVLQGPSGSGKSTPLRLLNWLEAPDAVTVRYHGDDLFAARDVLVHRREVGMVFQAPVLFPGTVADNLAGRPAGRPARAAAGARRAARDVPGSSEVERCRR